MIDPRHATATDRATGGAPGSVAGDVRLAWRGARQPPATDCSNLSRLGEVILMLSRWMRASLGAAAVLAPLATLIVSHALVVAAPLSTTPGQPIPPPVRASDSVASAGHEQPQATRVLFIVGKNCARCDKELQRLRRPGGDFKSMRARGWKIGAGPENHLQIVERDTIPDLVQQLDAREYPVVACISNGRIVRSFKSGCTTPLDAWTFGFLAKGVDERPPGSVSEAAHVETTGHWPLRGNHWSIDDDWSPTRDRVIQHLRGAIHGHQIRSTWDIESWSFEELRSLHDDLHEREMGGVSATTRSQTNNQFSAASKIGGR
jgi:hypothetical protein